MPKRKPAKSSVMGNPITPAKKKVSKPSAPNASETQVTQVDPFVPNEFGVIPPQTGELVFVPGKWNGKLDTQCCATPEDTTQIVSSANQENPGDENKESDQSPSYSPQPTSSDGKDTPTTDTTQPTTTEQSKNPGNLANPVADIGSNSPVNSLESLLPSHARLPGEGRAAFWERTRKALRAIGMPRGQGPGTAYEMATRAAEREFPPKTPEPEPVIVEELPAEPEPNAQPISQLDPEPDEKPAQPEPISEDHGVSGLGELPRHWPELPANAQLQVEIAWVTANRLRVRSGKGVDLARALSPAPSYSALSWLETSILFPSKFADISVKATADQDDEKEFIKREKMAIEEVRSILKEMLAPPAPQ